MGLNYKKLGGFIRTVDERNSDLAITNLQGVSITKEFIPSIANIIGTDLSTYKIVRTGQFAYGPVTSRNGDKVSIALLKGDDCIISSSYMPFEVYKPDELLPEYLMLWFMRPEFDRYARFMSNGSAREVFDWDCMCGVELPVPSIDEQRKIVHDYQVITDRILLLSRINDNLFQQTTAYFKELFEDAGFKSDSITDIDSRPVEKLSSYVSFAQGTQVPVENQLLSNEIDDRNNYVRFIRIVDYTTKQQEPPRFIKLNNNQCYCSSDDIVMVRYGNVGLVGRGIEGVIANNMFKIIPHTPLTNNYLYYYLTQPLVYEYIVASCGGSAMPSIKHSTIGDLSIKLPSAELLTKFDVFAASTEKTIRINEKEIVLLRNESSMLLAQFLNR